MDDGPSFVSPNGSFENGNISKKDLVFRIESDSLDDLQVEEPTLRHSMTG